MQHFEQGVATKKLHESTVGLKGFYFNSINYISATFSSFNNLFMHSLIEKRCIASIDSNISHLKNISSCLFRLGFICSNLQITCKMQIPNIKNC